MECLPFSPTVSGDAVDVYVKNPVPDKGSSPANTFLAAIVNSSDDAIISKDLSGTITTWNKAAERIFGYTAAEVIGGPISIIIPPDKGGEEIDILQRISRGERLDHYETVRVRKDGQRIDISVTISPLVEDGRVVGASKIARDVTEQKRIEREIQNHRARLQVTLESIGDAVIVTNPNGDVDFMNPVAEALTGWKTADAHGAPLEAVFNIVNQTTRKRVENPASRALKEGTTVPLANHTVLVSKAGSEYAIDDTAAPIKGAGEDVLGAVLVFRDVSGARADEDYRARLAAIVQFSDDAIVSKDLNGRIMSWNPGAVKLFGYPADEAIGRPISMVIPAERLAEETAIIEKLRRGERIEHFETVRITKDRRKIDVSLTVSPIFDSEGHVIGASKIARDITERKAMERELIDARSRLQRHSEHLEQMVSERTADLEAFTYSVAHDLRAPLRRLEGFISSLQQDLGSGLKGDAGELLTRSGSSLKRMDRLVTDLLKLSQITTDGGPFQPVNLDEVLQQVLAELRPSTEGRQIQWHVGRLSVVYGDPGLIRQVFTNLLSNAIKYTRPQPTAMIEVNQTSARGDLAFYVRDNGVGFSMEKAAKLFTPFHRLHHDTEFEGTGIGLAIVDRIMRKHGGQVWAEAQPGGGATFFFSFGAASATAPPPTNGNGNGNESNGKG